MEVEIILISLILILLLTCAYHAWLEKQGKVVAWLVLGASFVTMFYWFDALWKVQIAIALLSLAKFAWDTKQEGASPTEIADNLKQFEARARVARELKMSRFNILRHGELENVLDQLEVERMDEQELRAVLQNVIEELMQVKARRAEETGAIVLP